MNLGEVKFRVQKQFGDLSGVQITGTDITNWVNDGMIHIVRQTECLQSKLKTNIVANQAEYVLPTDWIKARRVTVSGHRILSVTLEELDDINPGRDTQAVGERQGPQVYYIWDDSLNLYPTPSDSVTLGLEIYYIRRPLMVSADTDIPEIPIHWHEDLVRYALSRAKETDEEDASAQRILLDMDQRLLHSREEFNTPSSDTYPSVRLLPGDDW